MGRARRRGIGASISRASLRLFLAVVVSVLLFSPPTLMAATGDLIRTFADPSASQTSGFGYAVTGVDGHILVSAPAPWYTGGAVHMFDPGTGALERTFNTPTPTSPNGGFGTTIADFQGKLLVGAFQEPSGLNIFDIHSGTRLDAYPNTGYLGISAAVEGAQILAGACNAGADHTGTTYLFDGTSHTTLQTYARPVPVYGGSFGYSVAFAGDRAVISDIHYPDISQCIGAGFVFDRTTGTYLHTLLDPLPSSYGFFGTCITAAGDDILIGRTNGDAVCLYDGSTFALKREFHDPEPYGNNGFGRSMAVMGDYLLVGAPAADVDVYNGGAVYLFDIDTGDLLYTYRDPTPGEFADFGASVAFFEGNVLVGECDSGGPRMSGSPGEAHLFEGPTTVPEPASLTLTTIALVALALRRRRRS